METDQIYSEIIDDLFDGVYCVDPDMRVVIWNKAAEDLTGYSKKSITGKNCKDFLKHVDAEGTRLCGPECSLCKTVVDGQPRSGNVFLLHNDGHRVSVLVNILPFIEDGKIIGAVEVFKPYTPDSQDGGTVDELYNMAMFDQLTGLPNRRKIEAFFDHRFNEMKLFQSKFCVVFLDIDNFGGFNNTYGHETGDKVLTGISKSISQNLRKTDLFGRWGGEEFIGIFEVQHDYEALQAAEKIRMLVSRTEIACENTTLSVTASLGVTMPRSDDSMDSIVKRADALMYQSKQNGKNRVTSG